MRKLQIYTLGCRLNQCESEAIVDSFKNANFEITNDFDANIFIVNTCTVTTKAEQKARRMIRKFARLEHNPIVIVTGCYAQMAEDELKDLSNRVIVCKLDQKGSLLELPDYLNNEEDIEVSTRRFFSNYSSRYDSSFSYDASSFSYHARAYLKIQDGCDNSCGFCRVSVARGKSRFLEIEEIIDRVKKLEDQGFKEIMLTGVNLSMYDHKGGGLGLAVSTLLKNISSETRLRFSSLEPDYVDDRLLDCFNDDRIQPHFHLPIQSASNRLLKYINRTYEIDKVEKVVRALNKVKDRPFIACDLITGLPSETDDEFLTTFDFVKDMEFSQLHVFPYSPRPQTALFDAKNLVPEYIRDERAKKLRELSKMLHHRYINKVIDMDLEYIAENEIEKGCFKALSSNYLEVLIYNDELIRGQLYKGKLEQSKGKLISKVSLL